MGRDCARREGDIPTNRDPGCDDGVQTGRAVLLAGDSHRRGRAVSLSVEPVFHAEAGDFLEVHEVAREERRVVGDADGGDFHAHRAGAETEALQRGKAGGCLVVEGKDGELRKAEEAVQESTITENLPRPAGSRLMAARQPCVISCGVMTVMKKSASRPAARLRSTRAIS